VTGHENEDKQVIFGAIEKEGMEERWTENGRLIV